MPNPGERPRRGGQRSPGAAKQPVFRRFPNLPRKSGRAPAAHASLKSSFPSDRARPGKEEHPMATTDTNPQWWNDTHTSGWERVKSAMKRDWEQTKADLTKTKGHELRQDVPDTVRQAA